MEIKRLIAFKLRNCDENPHGPRDIKTFRLVSTEFSAIGAEFLLPVIHLTFQSRSFERLRAISEHPVLSQHVKHLLYEADTFGNPRESEEEWVGKMLKSKVVSNRKLSAKSAGNEDRAEWSVYDQRKAFKAEVAVAELELSDRYKACMATVLDQQSIRHQSDPYNAGLMAKAIIRLPNLTEATLSFHGDVLPHTNAFKRAYPEYPNPSRHDYNDGYSHMTQICSMLDGFASAEPKLRDLRCSFTDWRFFQIDGHRMSRIKCALKHLESFSMIFWGQRFPFSAEDEVNYEAFLQHREYDFLSAAKDLKALSLKISDELSRHERVFKHVVGTSNWASLRVVELDGIRMAEETLIDFLQRHALTLKELGLHHFYMINGDWASALPRIRKAVRLEDFRATGRWRSARMDFWLIDTCKRFPELGESPQSQRYRLGTAVKTYILHGGTNPFLDHSWHPHH